MGAVTASYESVRGQMQIEGSVWFEPYDNISFQRRRSMTFAERNAGKPFSRIRVIPNDGENNVRTLPSDYRELKL